MLLGKDLMDVVDRTKPKLPNTATAEEKPAWKKKNNLALSILSQSIDESMLKNVMNCVTSKQIWKKLKLIYKQNASENVHTLQQDFYKYTMAEGELIADFFGKIEVIVSKLASWRDTTFNDQAVMAKILCNLPEGFNSLIPIWRMQPEATKTLDNLILQLLMTKGMIKSRTNASISTTAAYLAKGKKPSN